MMLYNRKFLLIGFTLLIGITFVFKLFFMQVVSDDYRRQASEITQAQITIDPARGLIYDRNGKLLASNQPVYNLMVIPREVGDMDTLAFCELLGIDKFTFIESLKKAQKYSYYKASRFLTKISRNKFTAISEQLHKYPGFYQEHSTVRFYPKKIGAHVLGDIAEVSPKNLENDDYYTIGDDIGKGGIELEYEIDLRGEKGVKYVYRNNLGVLKEKSEDLEGINAIVGKELVSTLDSELQEYGELLMSNKRGCIVAIEPKSGEVLCMVTAPNYDPNILIGNERGKNFNILVQDSLKPLYNRAIKGEYRPGSIFKLVQSLVAMEMGVITPETRIHCNRAIIGCHGAHSNDDLLRAIQHSCNPYFREVMRRMVEENEGENRNEKARIGLAEWNSRIKKFGFGTDLGLDLPGVHKGFIPDVAYYDRHYGELGWAYSTIYSISIGEGENLCTPIQMANLAAILANKGYFVTPHLVRSVDGVNLYEGDEYKNEVGVQEKYFDVVQEAMQAVVEIPGGTASRARTPGITVCGKTGTVQNDPKKDHSVFIAFAPKEDPKIAIAVYVESAGFGGTWAAPIASLMIEKYITREVTQEAKEQRILEADFKYNE